MIIDKLLQLSDKQIFNGGVTEAVSTNVIDFGQAHPNTGMDDQSKMVITVDQVSLGNGSYFQFAVEDSADNATFEPVAFSGQIPLAVLNSDRQVVIALPSKLRRYCRLHYYTNYGAGSFSAQIVTGIQQNTPYPQSPRIS